MLLKKSQEGTRVIYIPGNHDDDMRAFVGLRFGNIEVLGRCIHTTGAGRRLLVLHGDEFDAVITVRRAGGADRRGRLPKPARVEPARALAARGVGTPLLVARAARQDEVRQGAALRRDVSLRVAAGGARRPSTASYAATFTWPTSRSTTGSLYCNDGDWVESCTALVENRTARSSS